MCSHAQYGATRTRNELTLKGGVGNIAAAHTALPKHRFTREKEVRLRLLPTIILVVLAIGSSGSAAADRLVLMSPHPDGIQNNPYGFYFDFYFSPATFHMEATAYHDFAMNSNPRQRHSRWNSQHSMRVLPRILHAADAMWSFWSYVRNPCGMLWTPV